MQGILSVVNLILIAYLLVDTVRLERAEKKKGIVLAEKKRKAERELDLWRRRLFSLMSSGTLH